MFVYLRSSRVLLPCLYTFVQGVCYCHVCIPSFKSCVIAMFVVYKHGNNTRLERRYTNMAMPHAWTKVYKHGNNTRLERRYTNMTITHGLNETFVQILCHCHVCIPSFKPCVIAMFVYLRSSRVLLPCFYTFVQACVIAMFVYLRSSCVLLPCLYTFVQAHTTWTKVYQHGNNTRLERRYTNMAITHTFNACLQTWQ
jgi:hypothetical protein